MASIFRSEKMALCQLYLSSETAYNCVSELGEIGLVQFRDVSLKFRIMLNPDVNSFQKKFVHEIRRCEEMERKLNYLETEAGKDDIEIVDQGDNPEAPQPKEMIDFEATFEKLELELSEVNSNAESLKKNFLELTELKHVLEASEVFFAERETEPSSNLDENLLSAEDGVTQGPVQLEFVAGVIERSRMPVFERMLWRVCRGNAFLRQQEISTPLKDPHTGHDINKVVFLVVFQGEHFKIKVKRICEGCRATLYPCPETSAERKEMIDGVKTRLEDLNTVLSQTNDHRNRLLTAAAKHLRVWIIKVRKMKGIYFTLNQFNYDVTSNCLIAEVWIPETDIGRIKTALCKAAELSGSTMEPILNRMETRTKPPTFHRRNRFTNGFQNLIDAYAICTYREINPGLYTTTTFPFLFGVMFGDCGHGIIMALFALYLVIKEKAIIAAKYKAEMFNMIFAGRYIVLLMGCFSIYTGFIYNDIYSKSFNIFGSRFHVGNVSKTAVLCDNKTEFMLNPADPAEYEGEPYPMGMDPIWQISLNKITFQNSYKMKISVIIGIIHMMFGLVLSLLNYIHFKKTIDILFQFIPQAFTEYDCDCEDPYMYPSQYNLQLALVVISIVMIPILLLPKPFILKQQNKNKMRMKSLESHAYEQDIGEESDHETSSHGKTKAVDGEGETVLISVQQESDHETSRNGKTKAVEGKGETVLIPVQEEEEGGGGIRVFRNIHTSNNSYYRIRIRLYFSYSILPTFMGIVSRPRSIVRCFVDDDFKKRFSSVISKYNTLCIKVKTKTIHCKKIPISLLQPYMAGGTIFVYIAFAIWSFLTIAILVIMEGLSAFLHTLRLHWVEFCSKFMYGEGYAFEPFSFKHFVEDEEGVTRSCRFISNKEIIH
ncbi:V-type proton ATPase subunit a isoform 1 [Armadillidium nasatum]|uniref:V-type proton ATPase subunit a n=1 Tax=Armadillidium nasatum TaxID=96803 RepID=A0A5N5TBU9_9CRUS|nr:V-type proton ATPase subunit a isoform 1 [Armadillidium nasatum]